MDRVQSVKQYQTEKKKFIGGGPKLGQKMANNQFLLNIK